MNRKLRYKYLLILVVLTTNAWGQSSFQHKDSLRKAKGATVQPGLWTVSIFILIALLILSYLLTKAIDKRRNNS